MCRGSFDVVGDIHLDKRCYSTGILDMQRASVISERTAGASLDLRIYCIQSNPCLPLSGELVAWRVAKLCLEPRFRATGDKILSYVGMRLSVHKTSNTSIRHVIVVFQGGVLTSEGLGYPDTTMVSAFSSAITSLSAPTPLLARGIMRQPRWSLEQSHINKDTLPFMGGTYVSSFDSILTWWTIAEDRNDFVDQHKNLHGSFVLICSAFFLAVLRMEECDIELVETIQDAHRGASIEDDTYAHSLVGFLGQNLN
jgi:hypothetical protein